MPEILTCTKQEWKDFVDKLKLSNPDDKGRRSWHLDWGRARSVVDFLMAEEIVPRSNMGRVFLQLFWHDTATTERQAEDALSRGSTYVGFIKGYPKIKAALAIF